MNIIEINMERNDFYNALPVSANNKNLSKLLGECLVSEETFISHLMGAKKRLLNGGSSGFLCLAIEAQSRSYFVKGDTRRVVWVIQELLKNHGTLEMFIQKEYNFTVESFPKGISRVEKRVMWIDKMLKELNIERRIEQSYNVPVVGRWYGRFVQWYIRRTFK